MGTFFKKLVYFIIPVILFIAVFAVIYNTKASKVNKRLHEVSTNYSILIMGDSVMQRISPAYFNDPTYNFAGSAEHYYFTYSKLKKLFSFDDSKIKHVVLGISVHNFAPVYQRLFNLRYSEGQRSLKRYLYFMDFESSKFFSFSDIAFNKNFVKGVFRNPYWGGFKESPHNNPEVTVIRRILQMHYSTDGILDPNDFSEQAYYLDQIKKLCRENNVTLFLVSTPVHPYYKNQAEDHYFEILEKVIKRHNDINYLNYLNDDISSAYMSDANHLNKEGAAKYSQLIANEVEKRKTVGRNG